MAESQNTPLKSQTYISLAQGNQLENHKPNDMDDLKSISVKRPSFPPSIDTESLVANLLKHKTKNPKMPNEFFIYRAALVKELKMNNYKIKMTKLSTLAADSWSKEPSTVKSAYRKLARETERQYLNARSSLDILNPMNPMKSSNNGNNATKISKKNLNNLNNNLLTLNSVNSVSNTKKFSNSVNEPSGNSINAFDISGMINVTYQPQYEFKGNDFTLMDDNSIFGMRPRYNQNTLYLTPPQDNNFSDDLSISTYSSENSSPDPGYWSNLSSPSSLSLPPSSTNMNELDDNNNFFAPLSSSIYELEGYYVNALTINDMSQNYPQFYEQKYNYSG